MAAGLNAVPFGKAFLPLRHRNLTLGHFCPAQKVRAESVQPP